MRRSHAVLIAATVVLAAGSAGATPPPVGAPRDIPTPLLDLAPAAAGASAGVAAPAAGGALAAERARLEQALARSPKDPKLRLQLAAALANGGSYHQAMAVLGDLLAQAPDPQTRKASLRMVGAIRQASARNLWAGSLSAVVRYQTNPAAIGLAEGVVGGPVRGDAAVQATAALGHSFFFGPPGTSNAWETSLSGASTRQTRQSGLDYWEIDAGTGPRLRLDGLGAVGATARPYVAASYADFAHHPFLETAGAGLAVDAPVGGASLDLSVERRQKRYFDSDLYPTLTDRDSEEDTAQAALRMSLTPGLKLGMAATYVDEHARTAFWTHREWGGSAAATYYYRPPFGLVGPLWSVSGGLARRYSQYDAPDPGVAPGVRRRDDEWRAGLTHSIPISGDLTLTQQIQWRRVRSSVGFYAVHDLGVAFGVTWAGSGRLAAPAMAPDRSSEPAAADWSGLYAGAHAGLGGGRSHWDADALFWTDAPDVGFPRPFDMAVSGGVFGGQIGALVQEGRWVFGLEATASLSRVRKTIASPYFPDFQTETTRIPAFATLAGRIGFVRGGWLIYAKAGYARARIATLFNDDTDQVSGGGGLWHSGVTAGFGLERRITDVASVALEYDRLDFARGMVLAADSNGVTGVSADSRAGVDSLGLRINFRLGGGAR